MSDSAPQTTWLTREAYDRLTAELDYLRGPWRKEIAKRIEEARAEGDLRENGGYHAAKDEQGKQEGRIRSLEALLRDAKVSEGASDLQHVGPGVIVTASVAGRENRFLLGNREIAGTTDVKVVSETSPVGAAILGLGVGESAEYLAPSGKQLSVTVEAIEPFVG